MSLQPIRARSADAWLRSLPERGPVILYKHSPICPVSARVVQDVAAFGACYGQVPIHVVDVVSQQRLSRDLARTLGIEHRSPQLVWLTDRQVDWSVEYYEIRGSRLEREATRRGLEPAPAPPAASPDWRPGWLRVAVAGPVVRRAAKTALVVGAVLIVVDHGTALARGSVTGAALLRMVGLVALPYLAVTTLTVLLAAWHARR